MTHEDEEKYKNLVETVTDKEIEEEENKQQNLEHNNNIEQQEEPQIEENQQQPDTEDTSTYTTTRSGRVSKPPTLLQPTWKGHSYGQYNLPNQTGEKVEYNPETAKVIAKVITAFNDASNHETKSKLFLFLQTYTVKKELRNSDKKEPTQS